MIKKMWKLEENTGFKWVTFLYKLHQVRTYCTFRIQEEYIVFYFRSLIYSTFPASMCVRVPAACTRCCRTLPTPLPLMSAGHNRRKRTGRMSYLFVPGFLSLPLSYVSLGSEPLCQQTGCNNCQTKWSVWPIFWSNNMDPLPGLSFLIFLIRKRQTKTVCKRLVRLKGSACVCT